MISIVRGQISRQNVHHHLSDLPQDMDVVAVEPVERRVKRPHRFVNDK